MRGRILLATVLGVTALVACSKRDSLYIEPGKDDRPEKHQPNPPPKAPPKR